MYLIAEVGFIDELFDALSIRTTNHKHPTSGRHVKVLEHDFFAFMRNSKRERVCS